MAIEVFFGTNRNIQKRNKKQRSVNFGTKLNKGKTLLHFGKAKINDNFNRVKKIYISKPVSRQLCCGQDIFDEIQDRIYKGIDTILFLHGFYNTFNNSLIGAAELKHLYETESKREYTMIVFSWPSKGNIFSYFSDQENARASSQIFASGMYQLALFLTELCWFKLKTVSVTGEKKIPSEKSEKLSCGRLHIVAHSMGNYVLRHVLQEMCKIMGAQILQMFDEILLIAADEDKDAFEHKHKFKLLPQLASRISVYFNPEDIPLIISELIMNDMGRMGSKGPHKPYKISDKVSLIDCRDVVTGLLEHDYHKTTPVVVRDIAHVLTGLKTKDIPGRVYSPQTNTYRLIDTETIKPTDHPDPIY